MSEAHLAEAVEGVSAEGCEEQSAPRGGQERHQRVDQRCVKVLEEQTVGCGRKFSQGSKMNQASDSNSS